MIRVKEMKAGYGNRTVVELEELSFREGSVTCILGKNGCGKSTFLRALAGVLRYQGSVEADGRELLDIPSEERARLIGYLPQKIVQADMTVSMLAAHGRFPWKHFPRKLNEEDRRRIRAAMDRAGILPLAEKNLKEISGGELKLSYVAMLLAQDTKVLLLDEPEAHLDQEHQELLYTILLELAAEGKTVIVVSHDLLKSMNYGNRICVFREGRAVLCGAPEEIVGNGGGNGNRNGDKNRDGNGNEERNENGNRDRGRNRNGNEDRDWNRNEDRNRDGKKDVLREALGVTIVPAVQKDSRYRYIFGKS